MLRFAASSRSVAADGVFERDRFIAVVQQLDVTYDLYSLSSEQILGMLPSEFDAWKAGPKPRGRRGPRKRD